MNPRAALRWLGIVAAAVAAAPQMASATDPGRFSTAEQRLFVDDHLRGLPRTATLEYTFARRGSLEQAFDDRASVRVGAPGAGGGRPVEVDFLSDTRRLKLPDIEAATGNPVILFFLERDVQEMHRLTGGSQNYYRKRIRMALAEGAQVRTVDATLGSRHVGATEIRIAPYHDDPARSRYEKFAEKTYVFTLSNEVPGVILEMRSEVPAAAGGPGAPHAPLLAEALRFTRMR